LALGAMALANRPANVAEVEQRFTDTE